MFKISQPSRHIVGSASAILTEVDTMPYFEQIGPLYMHNVDDIAMTIRRYSNPIPQSFVPQPQRMSHRGRHVTIECSNRID